MNPEIEPGHPTMPTAVFHGVEGLGPHEAPRRLYGRAAVAAYVEGNEGRLMRSMKNILGSSLVGLRLRSAPCMFMPDQPGRV